jgi:hypothetical protein
MPTLEIVAASPAVAPVSQIETAEEIYQKFLASTDQKETDAYFDRLAEFIW